MSETAIQQIREKLEEAQTYLPNNSSTEKCISKALSLLADLEKPVCQTCGGTGLVDGGPEFVEHLYCGQSGVPCPDCQGEAGEFVKKAKELRKKGATHEQWEYATVLGEATDLIESLQQQLKEAKDEYRRYRTYLAEPAINRMNGYATENTELKEQLAAKEEELLNCRKYVKALNSELKEMD